MNLKTVMNVIITETISVFVFSCRFENILYSIAFLAHCNLHFYIKKRKSQCYIKTS